MKIMPFGQFSRISVGQGVMVCGGEQGDRLPVAAVEVLNHDGICILALKRTIFTGLTWSRSYRDHGVLAVEVVQIEPDNAGLALLVSFSVPLSNRFRLRAKWRAQKSPTGGQDMFWNLHVCLELTDCVAAAWDDAGLECHL